MAIPSVYINLEDDVSKVVDRLRRNPAGQLILVCPKRCLLFSDSINLRLLKKQMDLLGKEVFILTMDEKGQMYAKEAGFKLKFLPKVAGNSSFSDIKVSKKPPALKPAEAQTAENILVTGAREIGQMAKKFVPAKIAAKISSQAGPPKRPQPARVKTTDTIFPPMEQSAYFEKKPPVSRSKKILAGSLIFGLVLVLAVGFLVLPKASVVVYARTEPVTRDMEITMGTGITSPDPAKLVMPATKVDETVSINNKFQSQGKQQVGNKATGTVQIYNFTRLPLNLKAATTALLVGSKSYSLVADALGLKPTAYKNAKTKEVDESTLSQPVDVIAQQGGEDYNLPAGTRLEITNQVFGSKPQLLYAKSVSAITGGTTRYLSVVSSDDVNSAKSSLQQQALAQTRDKLSGSGLALPDQAFNFTVIQFSTDNPVGAATPNFQGNIQVRILGLAYKTDDLQNLIAQRIGQTISGDKTLKPNQPDSITVVAKPLDPAALLDVLEVHYQGQAVYTVDLRDMAPQLVGKSQSDAYELLRSKAQIDRVDITLAPAWQKSFPWFASRIKITVSGQAPPNQ